MLALSALVATACAGPAAEPAAPPPVRQVIEAERAFSRSAVEIGSKPAFLRFFADDVVTFGPGPRVGRAAVEEGPDLPPLEWWPEVAEASAGGDMGYTTGPYRATLGDGSAAWGHYHSVWRRQSDGAWKVVLDVGGPHGAVPLPDTVAIPDRGISPEDRSPDEQPRPPPGPVGSLPDAEARCMDLLEDSGPDAFLDECAWPDARIYRPGRAPIAAADLLGTGDPGGPAAWATGGADAAASGDLGYTWGSGTARSAAGPDTSATPMSYARFWRPDGGGRWRVVVEVVVPAPGEGGGG